MDIKALSAADVARCFGVDKAMITRWKRAGMPEYRGRFDLPKCIDWRMKQAAKPKPAAAAEETDKDRWLAAVRREQAKKARLERLQLEGNLVPYDEALLILGEEITAAKNAFRGIGRKLALRLVGKEPAEIEGEICDEIDQILNRLATRRDKKGKKRAK